MDFSTMSKEQLINYCRNSYKENGIEILTYAKISETGNLYFSLYKYGITINSLIAILDLKNEYDDYKQNNKKWSLENILQQTKEIITELGYLPPAEWFRKNGYGSLVNGLYESGKTFAYLREELNSNESSSFVQSRNGMRWRSHPEASFSNFLYTRGIEHELGRKYPDGYSAFSGLAYGYYDTKFLDKHGRWIDVEIWGDKPNGHKEEFYAHKRKMKEDYNKNNPCFIGIEFKDCFVEERLIFLLEPYIGVIEPYIFEKPTDEIIPSVHWSNADELIEYCKDFVKQFDNQEFPTEDWLRKRGKWADREGVAYNTLSIYIKQWIGGVRKLRELLKQSHVSTETWSRERALEEYKKWYEKYNMLVGSSRARYKRGQIQLPEAEFKKACRIEAAIIKHVGSATEAQKILRLKINTQRHYSNKDELIEYCKEFVKQFENQEFPAEDWLRKKGKWANRKGSAYNALANDIKRWIGGVRILREALNQSHVNTKTWDKEKALEEYKKWYEKYNISAGLARSRHRNGQIQLTETEFKRACRIESAISKYVGNAKEAQRILGLEVEKVDDK